MVPGFRHSPAVFSFTCLVLLSAAVAEAQVIQPPRRVFRPAPASDRFQQDLTLEMDLLGGVDDNLSPQGGGGQSFLPRPTGYSGYAATRMRYLVGRPARSLEVRGGGFVNSYRNVGLTPSYGGDVGLQGRTEIGRRMSLSVSQQASSDPYFSLGAFSTLQPMVTDSIGSDAGVLDSSPTQAITEIRSLTLDTGVTLDRQWTPKTRTAFSYRYNDRQYEGDSVFDHRQHSGDFTYDRSIGRSSGIETSYQYSDFRYLDLTTNAGGPSRIATKSHTLEAGFRYGKDVSRTRRVQLAAGAGTVHTEWISRTAFQPREFWAPSGYGRASVDVGRSWTLDANYRRSVSVLQGVATGPRGGEPDVFLTDAASVSLGGRLGDRIETVFSGGFSNGATGGVSVTTEDGRFDAYTVSAQVSVRVTDWWSALTSFTHYQYTLNTIASQTLGVPPELDRNAVYVGVSLRVPMVGALIAE